MSALNDRALVDATLRDFQFYEVEGFDVDDVRRFVGQFFWRWYDAHQNDVILRKRVVIFNISIRVRDLRSLFELLFGERPSAPVQ